MKISLNYKGITFLFIVIENNFQEFHRDFLSVRNVILTVISYGHFS